MPLQPDRVRGRAVAGARPGPLAPRQRPRRAGPRALRRTAARQRGDAPRQQHPDRRERLGRAVGARRPGAAPVHPRGAGRGVRRPPPPRAARPRRHHDRVRAASGPAGGHVPRGRHLGQLPVGPARGALAGRPARPPVRGLGRRGGAGVEVPRGHLRAGVQRHRDRPVRQGAADPHRRSDDPVPRPSRGPQGSVRAARRDDVAPAATCGCGWPGTDPRPSGCAGGSPGTRASSGSARSPRTRSARGCGGPTSTARPSLRGESFGVVLLEAMAASTAIVASDLAGYRRVARPDQDAVLVPPGDAEALAGGAGVRCWPTGSGPRRWWSRARSGCWASPWTAWPTATWSSTSEPVRPGLSPQRAPLRRRISGGHPVAICAEVQSTWALP